MRTRMLLLAVSLLLPASAWADPPPKGGPRFPALESAEAWKLLPRETPTLPSWARTMAAALPRTTGAMLELDYVHRVKNPLGPVLAGKIRWASADANQCDYARRYAESDLRRAGLSDDDMKKLSVVPMKIVDDEQALLAFARKLTLAAYTVTDEEMADLMKRFGPEKMVAVVHTLACANFQQRIFFALGVQVEENGPLPPVEFKLDPASKPKAMPRPEWKDVGGIKAKVAAMTPNWGSRDFDDVQKALENQKGRKGRIAPPPADPKGKPTRIVWSQVSGGYQPLLTKTWGQCLASFQQESQFDKVFANTMFWVITRSNECFY
jgi:alkylhydroperoxidase family enzyme